jgi:hypothetical protein
MDAHKGVKNPGICMGGKKVKMCLARQDMPRHVMKSLLIGYIH